MHITGVPRLIRNKSLPINLTEMTENHELKFSYESRICNLKESRRIIKNRCRHDSEYRTKTTNAHVSRTYARTRGNKKSQGETGRTRDS